MPIHHAGLEMGGLIRTVLDGTVTDQELVDYYTTLVANWSGRRWLELVDGRHVDVRFTADGYARLMALFAARLDILRDGRVAMVAGNDVTYGMFRMWEMQREDLGYIVRVFRDMDEALGWITRDATGGKT
jgi:hypothetical protein